MTRSALGSLSFLLLSGCVSTPQPTPEDPSGLLDGSAVECFWKVQDQLASGLPVGEGDWEAMFATPGYQWQAGDEETRARVREQMRTAFDPNRARIEEAAAAAEGYAAVRWQHYERIREDRAALAEYYDRLRRQDVIARALTIVQEYLPPGTVQSGDWDMPVRLLFFGPDAFAGDDAIYVDLLHAMDRDDELVLLLAHEFHHEYYEQAMSLPALEQEHEMYWVLHTLRQLHQEGIADQIDKRIFPLTTQKGLSPRYKVDFNHHYRAAPETLVQLDAALVALARTDRDRTELAREAWSLMHYGAHPEGFYMANVIRDAQGSAALLEDVGDPFAFLRRFQSVDPVFSEEALTFLDRLEKEWSEGEGDHSTTSGR